jgi:hypothetical protein
MYVDFAVVLQCFILVMLLRWEWLLMVCQIRGFVETNKLRYPVVLTGDEKGGLKVTMDSQELAACGGDAEQFVKKLREKGALSSASASL